MSISLTKLTYPVVNSTTDEQLKTILHSLDVQSRTLPFYRMMNTSVNGSYATSKINFAPNKATTVNFKNDWLNSDEENDFQYRVISATYILGFIFEATDSSIANPYVTQFCIAYTSRTNKTKKYYDMFYVHPAFNSFSVTTVSNSNPLPKIVVNPKSQMVLFDTIISCLNYPEDYPMFR